MSIDHVKTVKLVTRESLEDHVRSIRVSALLSLPKPDVLYLPNIECVRVTRGPGGSKAGEPGLVTRRRNKIARRERHRLKSGERIWGDVKRDSAS